MRIKPALNFTWGFLCALILSAILSAGCTRGKTSPPLTSDQSVAMTNSVRAFAAAVADDVTKRGPVAWRDHFADTPSFFMAAEGRLVFANSNAATRGIQELTRSIAHIELRWGDPVVVDPMTSTLGMMAAPYHEVLVDSAGHRVEQSGYFTGLVELGPAGWKFRNAHWSVAASASPASPAP
jgi:hypothetical protein